MKCSDAEDIFEKKLNETLSDKEEQILQEHIDLCKFCSGRISYRNQYQYFVSSKEFESLPEDVKLIVEEDTQEIYRNIADAEINRISEIMDSEKVANGKGFLNKRKIITFSLFLKFIIFSLVLFSIKHFFYSSIIEQKHSEYIIAHVDGVNTNAKNINWNVNKGNIKLSTSKSYQQYRKVQGIGDIELVDKASQIINSPREFEIANAAKNRIDILIPSHLEISEEQAKGLINVSTSQFKKRPNFYTKVRKTIKRPINVTLQKDTYKHGYKKGIFYWDIYVLNDRKKFDLVSEIRCYHTPFLLKIFQFENETNVEINFYRRNNKDEDEDEEEKAEKRYFAFFVLTKNLEVKQVFPLKKIKYMYFMNNKKFAFSFNLPEEESFLFCVFNDKKVPLDSIQWWLQNFARTEYHFSELEKGREHAIIAPNKKLKILPFSLYAVKF